MNKEGIIYMFQKILYKNEMLELKKVLKEKMLFFVLQIQKKVLVFKNAVKALKNSHLRYYRLEGQFSVLDSGFSVLVPAPSNFNSLYSALDSLKMKK